MGEGAGAAAGATGASAAPSARAGGVERGLRLAVALALLAAAVATLASVRDFGQRRFFTVDEFHYGHATWLVSVGQWPYADFYEHHFPLSYVLHAPFLPRSGSFPERALWLRAVAFDYLAALALVLAATGYVVTRNPFASLLSACLPFAIGFGLMSAIDYRADNTAACTFVAALALLEANRAARRRAVAAAAGVLLGVAVFMTQKMIFLAGVPLLALLCVDAARRRRARAPNVAAPGCVVLAGCGVALLVLGAAAAHGLLAKAAQITLVQAFEHERLHPAVGAWKFVRPWLEATPLSTLPLAAAAVLGAVAVPFWGIPLLVALAGGLLVKAQYPYNFVLPCLLAGICAVRGFAIAVERYVPRRARPLLYLLPLAVLPDQLGYVSGAASNRYQLAILAKIEAYTGPDDAVIDNAGGALFRPHGSYYFVHGGAHRRMFHRYFATRLVDDYRRSRALFWIQDFRLKHLPGTVQRYFHAHYIEADGRLYALGFETPATGERGTQVTLDVVRAGVYHVFPVRPGAAPADAADALVIGGQRVEGGEVRLREGPARVSIPAHAPAWRVTPLPPAVFTPTVPAGEPYARLFE